MAASVGRLTITADCTNRIYGAGLEILSGGSQAGGTIKTEQLDIDGGATFEWSGGKMGKTAAAPLSTTTLRAGATLNMSGNANKILEARTLRIFGAAVWSGNGDLVLAEAGNLSAGISIGSDLQDGALFRAEASGSIVGVGALFEVMVYPGSELRSQVPEGTTRIDARFHNLGKVTLVSGNLTFYRRTTTFGDGTINTTTGVYDITNADSWLVFGVGGRHDFDGGLIKGPGRAQFMTGAQVTVESEVYVTNVDDLGMSLSGGGSVFILGNYDWHGGTWTGTGGVSVLPTNGNLRIYG